MRCRLLGYSSSLLKYSSSLQRRGGGAPSLLMGGAFDSAGQPARAGPAAGPRVLFLSRNI